MKTEPEERLTANMLQELRSRTHLSARLLDHGAWIVDHVHDLGEDLLCRIYENGKSSGITFFVQLKSVDNIGKLRIKGNYISHPFKIKDLRHWSVSPVPVILIVWDMHAHNGYWISVFEAIAQLNERKQSWDSSTTKSVQVWFSESDQTDEAGLEKLRYWLGSYYVKGLLRDRSIEISGKFSYPNTDLGDKAANELIRFIETGDPVIIDKQFIHELHFSDWYERLQGNQEFSSVMLSSIPGKSIPVRIDAVQSNGQPVSIPHVDLRIIKLGTKEATVSNERQLLPVLVKIVLNLSIEQSLDGLLRATDPDKTALSVEFETNTSLKSSIQDIKDALAFFNALEDCIELRIIGLSDARIARLSVPEQAETTPLNPRFLDLIDKLFTIQSLTNRWFILENWSIANDDAASIDQVFAVLTTGKVAILNQRMSVWCGKQLLSTAIEAVRNAKGVAITSSVDQAIAMVLGNSIDLGQAKWQLTGIPQLSVDELQAQLDSLAEKEAIEIPFFILEGTGEFEKWANVSKS